MLFVIKTTYLIMRACVEPCCADSPNSPTLAEPCHADSPDSPTLDKPCRADSPNSPTLNKPCRADSPDSPTLALASFWEKCDSPRHIRASNARVSQIWREWPLLSLLAFLITSFLKISLTAYWVLFYFHISSSPCMHLGTFKFSLFKCELSF